MLTGCKLVVRSTDWAKNRSPSISTFFRQASVGSEVSSKLSFSERTQRTGDDIAPKAQCDLARGNTAKFRGIDSPPHDNCPRKSALRHRVVIEGLGHDLVKLSAAVPPRCFMSELERTVQVCLRYC